MSGPNNDDVCHDSLPQSHGEEDGAPLLTGASGMQIIDEMFQRQARRLESQHTTRGWRSEPGVVTGGKNG